MVAKVLAKVTVHISDIRFKITHRLYISMNDGFVVERADSIYELISNLQDCFIFKFN
jgi:hypothetical protein